MMNLPNWLLYIYTAVFGLVFGSFATVVIARLPGKKSIIRPPSHCPKCSKPLKWFNNIPVFSFLFQGGRCSKCHAKISIRYPLVEILMAFLFVFAAAKFGFSIDLLLRDFVLIFLLVAITFIDLEHRIIPDALSLGGLAWGLITSPLNDQPGWMMSLVGSAIGFSVFYAMAWLYLWKTGRSGMGGGDIKLLAMLGSFVGPLGVLQTILISSVLGSVVGLLTGYIENRKRGSSVLKTSIPYGPFLAFGGLAAYLLSEYLWSPYLIPS